jgi:N-acetylglucosaminyl-diphospho-decaprenol L-rhamnosyltransferase
LQTPPQLSIIIVNHRTGHILGDCLEAIATSDHNLSTEVIIVDNPPETGILCSLPENLQVKRLATTGRIGFAAAANMGAAAAHGDVLLFVNPDIILDISAISRLLDVFRSKKDAGIITGRLINTGDMVQPSCRRFPTLRRLMVSRGSVIIRLSRLQSPAYFLPDYPSVTAVDWCAAALILTSRPIFESIGGFDPTFHLYLEDTDLCFRLARAGYKTYYEPAATASHIWGASTSHYRFRRIVWHHVSVWRYFVKHRRSPLVLSLLFPLLLGNVLLSLAVELFTFHR